MDRLLQLIPENIRLFVKEVLENELYSEEQKDRLIRENVDTFVWNEYQQWKQTNVLKNKLPFLSEVETDTEVSVILEIVHDAAISEEVRDKYLRSFLSSGDYVKYEQWKPTNVVKTPDSFLRLLDDNARPLVERRLKAEDLAAVELLMTKLASSEAKPVYYEWKAQIESQMKFLSRPKGITSGKQVAETALERVDINGNRQIYHGMVKDLIQKKEHTSDAVVSLLEQSVALPNALPLSTIPSVNSVEAHIEGSNKVADNLAMLIEQASSIRKNDETIRLSAEIITTPVTTPNSAPVDNVHDFRRQIREDSMNIHLANVRLSGVAAEK